MSDEVNHPAHYTIHPSGIECIEVTRHMNFNVGNAVKYLWRAGLKSQERHIEDLQKAMWYINDEIETLKGIQHDKENQHDLFQSGSGQATLVGSNGNFVLGSPANSNHIRQEFTREYDRCEICGGVDCGGHTGI